MHLPSRGQLALGTAALIVGGRLVCKGPASRPFYGRHALLASTSLSTNNSAAADGATLAKPDSTEAPTEAPTEAQRNVL
ncbi:hypothetical protein Ndes2526B_g04317 [Nannochloris sp. 'desiccata']